MSVSSGSKAQFELAPRSFGVGEGARTALPVAIVVAFGIALALRDPGFFLQDDVITQYLPASRDVARALWSGEWPLLTPYSWFGASLAGEFQHGVFSPFELALALLVWGLRLPLEQTAATLALVHLAILAAGAFRLARAYRCGPSEATVVALIASANGWMMNWGAVNWYPGLRSFIWLPWAWYALEQLVRAERARPLRVVGVACLLMLLCTAGWLYTIAMMLLVSTWVVIGGVRTTRSAWPIVRVACAWALGLALASPALVMLFDYGQATERGHVALSLNRSMMLPIEALLGMALPAYRTYWNVFSHAGMRRSVEIGGALVPCVCWLSALLARGRPLLREQLGLLALVALCALLATSPGIEGLRYSFRWMPLLHLSLALLGMQAWSLASAPSWWPALAALAITLVVWLRALGLQLDDSPVTFRLGLWLLGFAAGWLALAFIPRLAGSWLAFAFVLASFAASYTYLPPNSEETHWAIAPHAERAEPLDAKVRYVSIWEFGGIDAPGPVPWLPWRRDVGGLRPGYTSLLAGVEVLNGYSPVGERGLAQLFGWRIHGDTKPGWAVRYLREIAISDMHLKSGAVDGLIVSNRYRREIDDLTQHGWTRAAEVPAAVVLHRVGPRSPRAYAVTKTSLVPTFEQAVTALTERAAHVLLDERVSAEGQATFAQATVERVREERNRSVASVRVPPGPAPALIAFARPWLPGWRARIGERELKVERYNGFLPAVRVPAGSSGELELRYFPRALGWALAVVAAALAACLAACAWHWKTR